MCVVQSTDFAEHDTVMLKPKYCHQGEIMRILKAGVPTRHIAHKKKTVKM